jgi:glucan phosphorylase
MQEKEKANETMSEDKTRDLDQQVLGPFVKSFHKRYERWKRQDLLLVALETFPKQVKKEKVNGNLKSLKAEFEKKLSDEG